MPPKDDLDLLREYATQKSERAFEELVRRHINFVYSSALRQAGDPHLAEEITQAAFIILAQKAGSLKQGAVLSGWLFNTVRFVAAAEFRRAARRRKYEQEAGMESWTQESNPGADWEQIVPCLDECLAQLNETDRRAVLLRFFEQKSFAEMGVLLGTNADAATKRASRAVEKLRQLFLKRGIVLSTAALAALVSANGVQAAPAGLTTSIAGMAVAHGLTATASTSTLIKGTLKLMAWTKMKTTVIAAVVVVALGTATITVTEAGHHGSGAGIRYLPDGSFIRLLYTAYGTRFSYSAPPPKPWQKSLAQKLPSAMASRFDWWLGTGGSSMSMSSTPGVTNLAVFTASEHPSRSRGQMTLVVFDQMGDESLAAFGGSTIGNDDGKHFKSIQGWMVSAFPRRAKTLGVRFNDVNSRKAVAEFEIPNPAFAHYPVWTPEPLPAVKTDGELSVTLTGFTTGFTFDNPEMTAIFGEVPATRATFHVELPGHPDQAWRPKAIEVSDATGNKWIPMARLTATTHTNDADEFTFAGRLWHSEAAWKLRAEFSRTAGFAPDETWRVGSIAVPDAKEVIKLADSTTIGDTTLSLVAITGTKAKQPGDMEWLAESGMVNISVHARPWNQDQRLSLVEVLDDRGRRVEIHPAADWNGGNNVFGLVIPPGAKRLVCTFALHKSKFVEFLAAPEFTGDNPASANR